MVRTRTARWLAVVVVLAALPLGASAQAQACVDGPASAASAQRPHTADGVGEALSPFADAGDIEAVWVGVRPADGNPSRPQYTANLAVGDLSAHPVGHLFVVDLSTGDSVGAEALADGSWDFGFYGSSLVPAGVRQGWVKLDSAKGVVDVDAGVISLDLPDYVLPPGTATRVTTMKVGAYVALVAGAPESLAGGPASTRLAALSDSTVGEPACAAQLSGLASA